MSGLRRPAARLLAEIGNEREPAVVAEPPLCKDDAVAPAGVRIVALEVLQTRRNLLAAQFEQTSDEREALFVRWAIESAPIEHGGAKRAFQDGIRQRVLA